MTAEVGIITRLGVVLAADSIATINVAGKSKFIITDKLFALSSHPPIGIMIYGNPYFTNIPWETVIKLYSSYIENKSFDTFKEYANDFLSFLVNDKKIYNSSYEKKLVELTLDNCLMGYGIELKTKNRQEETLSTKIENSIKIFSKAKFLNGFDENFIQLFMEKHRENLKNYLSEIVNINIDNQTQENLILLCAYTICKSYYLFDFSQKSLSGIVIAGYGNREIYPAIVEYNIIGIVCGKLIYQLKTFQKILETGTEHTNTLGTLLPFAQKDVVETYIYGIDPDIKNKLFEKINSIFSNLFDVIQSESNNSISNEFSNQYRDKINEVGKKLQKQIEDTLIDIQKSKYSDPLAYVIGFLGKQEMSTLAEALVNLTSTRRKFTTDAETVGGETDVALITISDGFKWIKKKSS